MFIYSQTLASAATRLHCTLAWRQLARPSGPDFHTPDHPWAQRTHWRPSNQSPTGIGEAGCARGTCNQHVSWPVWPLSMAGLAVNPHPKACNIIAVNTHSTHAKQANTGGGSAIGVVHSISVVPGLLPRGESCDVPVLPGRAAARSNCNFVFQEWDAWFPGAKPYAAWGACTAG